MTNYPCPSPRRSPVMALARRILSTERRIWAIWETSLKGRINDLSRDDRHLPALVLYIRLMRRRNRLEQALNSYLP